MPGLYYDLLNHPLAELSSIDVQPPGPQLRTQFRSLYRATAVLPQYMNSISRCEGTSDDKPALHQII
ncbi:unnamed protein product [marine sediment metagenome]|uniref:Uncharacterized protein n=1 Tax=marine sediment metagenome TaxID=412755 RepID=X1UXC1_9ZZZZ